MSSSILALESFFKKQESGVCLGLVFVFFPIYFIWLHRVFIAMRHVGSQFPYRRLNLHPLHWKAGS